MSTIVTRAGKGSPLTNTEVDNNFTNLNTDKVENLVEDTTPQLGGDLDLNSHDITGTGDINITGTVVADSLKIDSGVFDINLQGSLDALPADNDESHIFTTSGSGSGFFAKYGALGLSSRNKDTSSSDIGFFTDKLLRVEIADTGGVFFYEDTGTTAKLTWDASDEDLDFKDSVRAVFGDGSDLTIEHNGSNSQIKNNTGVLQILQFVDDGDIVLSSDDGFGGTTNYFRADGSTGEAILYHYGSQKLATKSTGIDVTGTVTADGLTVDGSANAVTLQSSSQNVRYKITDGTVEGRLGVDGGVDVYSGSVSAHPYRLRSNDTKRIEIASNGDISFYDDAGTSQDFYWDASTSRLGLGTTSPSATLDLTSSSNGHGLKIRQGNAGSGYHSAINFEGSNGSGGYVSVASIKAYQETNGVNGSLRFYTDTTGSEAMRIDSSGNVGIGTASVTAKFETVGGTGGSETTLGMLRSASTDTNTSTVFRLTNTTATGSFPPQGAADIGAIRTNSGASGATDLFIRTSSGSAVAERMRITSDGNVYIGDSSPGYYPGKLDVTGTITARVASSGLNTNFNVRDADQDDLFSIYTDGTTGEARLRSHSDNPTSPFMTFYTGSSEAMRIDSSGNVGIGTTSPNRVLHAEGTASTFGDTRSVVQIADNTAMAAGVGGGVIFTGKATTGQGDSLTTFAGIHGEKENGTSTNTAGAMVFSTRTSGSNPAERMRIDSSGKVGIGTTSPSSLLHLEANNPTLQIKDTSRTSSLFINADYASAGIDAIRSDINNLRLQTDSNTSIQFVPNGSEVMRVVDGKVGIGTTSPSELLDVRGNSGSDRGVQIKNDGAGRAILVLDAGGTSNTSLRFKNQGTETARIESLSTAPLTFKYGSSNTEAARIDSSGSFLVGKTASGVANEGFEVHANDYVGISKTNFSPLILNRKSTDGTIVDLRKDNTTVGSISTSGGTTSYNTTSDYRLKENVTELNGASDRLNELQVKQFNLIGHDQTVDGFLAHEVQNVVPEAVTGSKDEVDSDGNPVYQSIDHSKLVPLLTAALQEALSEIDSLKSRIATLEAN